TIIPHVGLVPVAVFIIAMSVTHTYLDVIPSIYLGAPDPDMVLSVLPGHRLLLEGKGLHAVRLTQIGSLGATIMSTALFAVFVKLVDFSSAFLDTYLPIILLGIVIFLLFQAKKKFFALILFLASGVLGLLVFNLPGLHNPLFAMLTGLFGTSTLLLSLQENAKVPQQTESPLEIDAPDAVKAVVSGQAAGFLTAVFPGLGAASAAALSTAFVNLKEKSFLVLVGSIGTVNFILSLVTYLVLDKARNGSIVAVRELVGVASSPFIVVCIGTVLLGAGLASIILTKLTPPLAKTIMSMPYSALAQSIIFVLILLAAFLSGWWGLLILLTATSLGVLAPLLGVQRIYLMGCLLVPVLSYFF
ncbi:hypothetical protein GOV10_02200, partial [Candidatus Woesearchaeota archaeon]|nr:hypothetical protein [Candidatus Woesearchaeota archaeon]